MDKRWDVLGLGCAAVDDALYVVRYPAGDTKIRVRRRQRRVGGLTAAALLTAARMGGSCAYAGKLGRDELSLFIEDELQRTGVDVSPVVRVKEGSPIHAIVVLGDEDHTRTIFAYSDGSLGAHETLPAAEVIEAARVLFVDTYNVQGQLRAARVARAAGIPIVADFERGEGPLFEELLALVDHLILSQEFALRWSGCDTTQEALQRLWTSKRSVVAATAGEQGCWLLDADGLHHQPAFPVDVVDTNGCGDVFHGAWALALAQGNPVRECAHIASAAAALKATQPGLTGVPPLPEIHDFIARAG
ncbi:MAG: hypothetical protein J4G17_01980 [Anaerolineae bacterium]|nr:hypothetical protein [Anaerolineae bacterium]